MRLVLDTRFPEADTVRLTVHAARPVPMTVRLRVPYWTAAASAQLNGETLASAGTPGSYLVLKRIWREGDRIELRLPMRLHLARMPDDPTLQAVMYGPLVLAGRLGTAGLDRAHLRAGPTAPRHVPEYGAEPIDVAPISAPSADPLGWLAPVAGRSLEFKTTHLARPITLVPLNRIFDERYAVYWRVVEPVRTGTNT